LYGSGALGRAPRRSVNYASGALGRAPCIHAHLHHLATNPGEKCGLRVGPGWTVPRGTGGNPGGPFASPANRWRGVRAVASPGRGGRRYRSSGFSLRNLIGRTSGEFFPPQERVGSLVQRLANILAFERRCIRSSGVVPHMPIKKHGIGCRGYPRESNSSGSGALLAPYLTVRLSRAPCWRGASTLPLLSSKLLRGVPRAFCRGASMRQAICETLH
jgi:hypothetical protein